MEFEEKNLKAAVKKAAKVLKVPVESLKYEVISYGSTGIFGLVGAKKAKIRVVTAQNGNNPAKPADVKHEAQKAVEKKETPDVSRKAKAERKRPEKRPEKPPEKGGLSEKAQSPGDVPPPEKVTRPEKEVPPERQEGETAAPPAEAVALGQTVIQRIVDKITEEATVRVETKEDAITYHVEGGKSALIIGKRGQTLEAIQYLVDRIVNRNTEKRIRLQIDVAGYLESKKANLEQRALHLAEKVRKTGKPVTVGELNVYDRKIVHVCLKEEKDIRTQSMGSGFYRKLVIFPKKGSNQKKRPE